jgi:cytochrome c-type biogenesis protein CcmE
MMPPLRKQRLIFISIMMLGIAIAAGLALYALRQNINLFYTPKDVAEKNIGNDTFFRLGGMVKKGSVVHTPHTTHVRFILTDLTHEAVVEFDGILPDLFREGQGIVTEGKLNEQRIFIASQVLAKHDARYVPSNMSYRKKTMTESAS